ncbi:MAG: tetratricopeptide repeat protein [Bryobacteraceae bacterium]|jgi:tetratricopeptide (TPR) repeat protein
MPILLTVLLLAAALSSPSAHAAPDTPGPAAQPQAPPLASETRGDIFMAEKKFREAIEAYGTGSPGNAVVQNKLGIAYQQTLQLDNARKSYERAIKLKPDYMEALNNLGTVYYARKNYRRAINWYNRALKTAPGEVRSATVYENLGRAWFNRKDYARASECMQTALQLDPEVFEHHGSVGQILEETSIEERARYHFYQAKVYAKSGRNDLALQYLRKALEEGFKQKKSIEEEPDFATLKDLPEFKELMARVPRSL